MISRSSQKSGMRCTAGSILPRSLRAGMTTVADVIGVVRASRRAEDGIVPEAEMADDRQRRDEAVEQAAEPEKPQRRDQPRLRLDRVEIGQRRQRPDVAGRHDVLRRLAGAPADPFGELRAAAARDANSRRRPAGWCGCSGRAGFPARPGNRRAIRSCRRSGSRRTARAATATKERSSMSPTRKSRSGCRRSASAIIAGLKSMPSPWLGLRPASTSPVPQPISRTRSPSGMRKRR